MATHLLPRDFRGLRAAGGRKPASIPCRHFLIFLSRSTVNFVPCALFWIDIVTRRGRTSWNHWERMHLRRCTTTEPCIVYTWVIIAMWGNWHVLVAVIIVRHESKICSKPQNPDTTSLSIFYIFADKGQKGNFSTVLHNIISLHMDRIQC